MLEGQGEERVLGGRWALECVVGKGTYGAVWRGRDLLTGEAVAVKLLRFLKNARLNHARESAALRLLRIPGIVRLLDDGVDDDQRYLVMNLVEGQPFPGPQLGHEHGAAGSDRLPWPELRRRSVALLETLARIHAAGFVHLDLKPSNVLVDASGQPWVLDLGVAVGSVFSPWDLNEGGSRGTPSYAAPEQIGGRAVDARTDLFSAAAMIYEAATGLNPVLDPDGVRLPDPTIKPLTAYAPDVDAPSARAIEAALSDAPEERPSSAGALLSRLDGQRRSVTLGKLEQLTLANAGPATVEELRGLFAGPDVLLHLAEDGAQLLYEISGGDRAAVHEAVDQWISTGLACPDEHGLVIDRADLVLLRHQYQADSDADLEESARRERHSKLADGLTAGEQDRLLHLIMAGRRGEVPTEALAAARRLHAEGDDLEASAALFEAWVVLREEQTEPHLERELLSLWTRVALAQHEVRPLVRLQHALATTAAGDPELEGLSGLVQVALTMQLTDGERSLDRIQQLAPFADEELECLRLSHAVLAARYAPIELERGALEDFEQWAEGRTSPRVQATTATLRGRLAFRESRFADAAAEHARAAALADHRSARLASRTNAASAWMEAGDLESALDAARAVRESAAAARLPLFEAYGVWLERSALYRQGRDLDPDDELLRALPRLGHVEMEDQCRFLEATFAWRRRMEARARALCAECEANWRDRSYALAADLARLLRAELGDALDEAEVESIARRAEKWEDPSLRSQVESLLVRHGGRPSGDLSELLERLGQRFEGSHRWELLSLDEMRALV